MAWLARIAENEIRDRADYHHRQRRDAAREVPLDDGAAPPRASVRSMSSRLILDERTLRLEAALERLSEDHRRVIVLRKLEERSWREVADRMGRGEDACRMLLARAMKVLTLEMETPA
jgi:RNA polymerase sigma-70 factor (ECF subfamily)